MAAIAPKVRPTVALRDLRAQIADTPTELGDVQKVVPGLHEATRTSSQGPMAFANLTEFRELYTVHVPALEGARGVHPRQSTSILGGLNRSLKQHGAAFSCLVYPNLGLRFIQVLGNSLEEATCGPLV